MKSKMTISVMLQPVPMTASALPRSSKLIEEMSEEGLCEQTETKEDPGAYRSTLDWLLIVTHPHYKHRCSSFYAGNSPPLKDQVSDRTLRRLDRRVSDVLKAHLRTTR